MNTNIDTIYLTNDTDLDLFSFYDDETHIKELEKLFDSYLKEYFNFDENGNNKETEDFIGEQKSFLYKYNYYIIL